MQAYTSTFYNMLNCFLNCKLKSFFISQNSFHTLKRQKEIMIDSQLSMIDRRWKRFKSVELENDARNTTDDSSFEGMMIACIGRLKNKLCKRKEKSLYSTRKNPFSPTTIYKKQGRECAMITYTLKHTHTHKLTCVWWEESANTPSSSGWYKTTSSWSVSQRKTKRKDEDNFFMS